MFNWFKYLKQKEPTITPIHYNPISNDHNDEIMNALWDIKEALDLPTEEVEIAAESRKKSIKNKK